MDLFRRPKKRNNSTRKREDGDDCQISDSMNLKDCIQRKRRKNPMVQSTKKHDDSKASSSSSDDSENDEGTSTIHSYSASGSAEPLGPRDQGATATLDIDTDISSDAQAQFERVQQQLKEGVEKDGKILYKGSALYGAKEAKDTIKGNAASGMNRIGPVRAPQFLRQTVRWDYAPDICKDYKETGYCTFGDSCKFVHDRSDYKHGWEIDQELEEGRYGQEDEEDYEIKEEDDNFPDECYICGNEFVDPIVTKCKHYFCESCALRAFKKSSKCPICNVNTDKIMNAAKDLIIHIRKKKELAAKSESSDEEKDEMEDNNENKTQDGNEDAIVEDEHSTESGEDNDEVIQMEDLDGLDGGDPGDSNESEIDDN